MNKRKENLKKLRLPCTRNGPTKAKTSISNYFSNTDEQNFEGEEDEEKEDLKIPEPTPPSVENSPPTTSTIPQPEDKPHEKSPIRSTRTKLKTFLPKEKRIKRTNADNPQTLLKNLNDFETPAKTIKTAPKVKPNPKAKSKSRAKSKKQPTIKSAFFQNEKHFSDVTAQYCLVDNINPDDMQLALALSRSEIETNENENEGIGEKLKKFGFQVSEKSNYESVYKLSKRKAKWANKFTPLTLRNPERQLEKINRKIEEILNFNLHSDIGESVEEVEYLTHLYTPALFPLLAENRIIQSDPSKINDFYVLNLFEPSTTKTGHLLKDVRLIPGRDRSPVHVKINLKDNSENKPLVEAKHSIEDDCVIKDLKDNETPIKTSPSSSTSSKQFLKNNCAMHISENTNPLHLNEHSVAIKTYSEGDVPQSSCLYIKLSPKSECIKQDSEREKTVSPFETQSLSFKTTQSEATTTTCLKNSFMHEYENSGSPVKTPPFLRDDWKEDEEVSDLQSPAIKRSKPENVGLPSTKTHNSIERRRKTHNFVESLRNKTIASDENQKSKLIDESLEKLGKEIGSQVQLRIIRASSPDIFADSDVEMESASDKEDANCYPISNIETFELFSSDEVKTSSDTKMETCDQKHNMIDLTQGTSNESSQKSSNSIPLFEPIQPYQDFDDLPSISLELNDKTPIQCEFFKDTNNSSFENTVLQKSNEILSFNSSVSEDIFKSISFNKSQGEDHSIDLTQDQDEDEIDCIILSDDEVNYSIRKADKSLHFNDEKSTSHDSSLESDCCNENQQEFSFVDFVATTGPLPTTQSEDFDLNLIETSNNPCTSLEMDLSKRSDFGILEEQSPFKTPIITPKKTPNKMSKTTSPKSPRINSSIISNKCRRSLSESFLSSPIESPAPSVKRFSSSNKFKEFTKSDDDSFSDLDDIDKLIYGSPTKKAYKKPTGLSQLLTGPLNDKPTTPEKKNDKVSQEFDFNGRKYLVRIVDASERPNFMKMTESALLDRLYRYGIKPLKRKQAVKILEYIYNQTHPCLVEELEPTSSSTTTDNNVDLPSQSVGLNDDDNEFEDDIKDDVIGRVGGTKFNFKDCWGHRLISDNIPSMEIKDEQYFFPTNSSKKISTAFLPLHIAWYNLLKSNNQLHEAILNYEPIDLQEVYLFFKSIGIRYDPKHIKYFFDSRSIIFRYDVQKSENSSRNRHIRKQSKTQTKKS